MRATIISSCLLAATTLITSLNARADIVTLNDNGGYGGPGFVEVAYGETMPWITTPWYDNNRFDGYYDQDGKMYYDQCGYGVVVWDKDGDAMLYAKWIRRADICVDWRDGTGYHYIGMVEEGEMMPPLYVEPRTGWIFKGCKDMDSDELYYDEYGNPLRAWDGKAWNFALMWESVKVEVTLVHGDESGIADKTIEADFGVNFPNMEVPEWFGHRFVGYFKDDGTMCVGEYGWGVSNCDSIEPITLYARWELVNVEIRFESGFDGAKYYTLISSYSSELPKVEKPVRRGFKFLGFYDENGNQYYDADMNGVRKIDRDAGFVLRAKWSGLGSAEELKMAIRNTQDGEPATIKLVGAVDCMTEELVIPAGRDITLDLNGLVIDRGLEGKEAIVSGGVIRVEGSLTIKDSFGGGRITGGNVTGDGGGILVAKNGVLRLLGGTVCGNTATGAGGGVYGEKHSAVFLGAGKIQGNKARNGCGIEIPCGTFRLCDDTSHEAEECNLHPYSPGLILMFK